MTPPRSRRRGRVVLAPNAFKGNHDAVEVVEAWREGLVEAGYRVDRLPLSDGGDGFLAVVRFYRPEVIEVRARVRDPLGRPIDAAWGWDPAARIAYVESAEVVGLRLVGRRERQPLEATSAGLGGLLRAAAELGVRRIVVGLGGSATVDGGLGVARALGFRLEDRRGRAIERPADLQRLARIVPPPGRPLNGVRLAALADVANPLLGPQGAATVFGPQKGADREAVARLEGGLERLAGRWTADLGAPEGLAGRRGAGAAGGLGAALVAVLGARLEPGAAWCGRWAGLAGALTGARAVLTGEGRYDAQSEHGNKVSGWVVERARRARAPVAVACGAADPATAERARARGVTVVDSADAGLGPGNLDRSGLALLAAAAMAALDA
jgi:glycerate kinase